MRYHYYDAKVLNSIRFEGKDKKDDELWSGKASHHLSNKTMKKKISPHK